ncbi:MAG: hypothetical protein Q8910_00885 [Bacteroidota bacterium]|nr:hypothetical protein [Bacteroidota bacterium]
MQYSIPSSTGLWLDEWGAWFGTPRLPNESDEDYRYRLSTILIRPKVTIPALIESIKPYISDQNFEVQIYEPYTNVRKFNVSLWGSEDKLKDNSYYSSGVMDILIPSVVSPGLDHMVNQSKSAGVVVFYTVKVEMSMPNNLPYKAVRLDVSHPIATFDQSLYSGDTINLSNVIVPQEMVQLISTESISLPISFPLVFSGNTLIKKL